jgi:hypothetical protein
VHQAKVAAVAKSAPKKLQRGQCAAPNGVPYSRACFRKRSTKFEQKFRKINRQVNKHLALISLKKHHF